MIDGVRPVARVQHGGPMALGCRAMLTGKLPSSICLPAGRSDHWLGSRTDPPGWAPGSFLTSNRASGVAASSPAGKTDWQSVLPRASGRLGSPPRWPRRGANSKLRKPGRR